MLRLLKNLTATLLLVVLVIGAPLLSGAQVADLIVGSWEWASTGCDDGSVVSTPQTEGFTLQCQYGAAADGAIYRTFRNGVLQAQGTYVLSQVPGLLGIPVDMLDTTIGESTTRYAFVQVVVYPDTGDKHLSMDDGLCGYSWVSRATVAQQGASWGTIKAIYR